jgi:hypothetical protein
MTNLKSLSLALAAALTLAACQEPLPVDVAAEAAVEAPAIASGADMLEGAIISDGLNP